MAVLGAWWWVDDPVREGEHLVSRWLANRRQGRLARGGALFLTDARMVFRPHGFDRLFGGRCWEAELIEVVAVDVAPRTGAVFDGGMVERLRVRLHDGAVELFVIDGPAQVAAAVSARLPGRPSASAG